MKITNTLSLMAVLLCSTAAQAERMEWKKFYYGAGFGSAEVPGVKESPSVLQLILGYPVEMPILLDPSLYVMSLEGGYTDVSDSSFDRYWSSVGLKRYINSDLDVLVRAGVEVGSNKGFFSPLAALGLEYKSDSPLVVRVEFIEREDSPVATVNFIYRAK